MFSYLLVFNFILIVDTIADAPPSPQPLPSGHHSDVYVYVMHLCKNIFTLCFVLFLFYLVFIVSFYCTFFHYHLSPKLSSIFPFRPPTIRKLSSMSMKSFAFWLNPFSLNPHPPELSACSLSMNNIFEKIAKMNVGSVLGQ